MPASGPLPSTPVIRMATVTISVPDASSASRSTAGETKRPVPINRRDLNDLPAMTSGSSSQLPPATTFTSSTRSPSASCTDVQLRRGTTCPFTATATASSFTPRLASRPGTSSASVANSHGCWLMITCMRVPSGLGRKWVARSMAGGVERLAETRRGSTRIGVGQDGRDDGDTGTASGQHVLEVVGGDAANGQHGHIYGLHDFAQLGEAMGWQARMAGGRKDVAERDII